METYALKTIFIGCYCGDEDCLAKENSRNKSERTWKMLQGAVKQAIRKYAKDIKTPNRVQKKLRE